VKASRMTLRLFFNSSVIKRGVNTCKIQQKEPASGVGRESRWRVRADGGLGSDTGGRVRGDVRHTVSAPGSDRSRICVGANGMSSLPSTAGHSINRTPGFEASRVASCC